MKTIRFFIPVLIVFTILQIEPALAQQNNFSVSPNPTKGLITIEFDGKIDNAKITLYNLLGEVVYSLPGVKFNTTTVVLNLSSFNEGVYLLQILTPEIKSTRKIVIEHYKKLEYT